MNVPSLIVGVSNLVLAGMAVLLTWMLVRLRRLGAGGRTPIVFAALQVVAFLLVGVTALVVGPLPLFVIYLLSVPVWTVCLVQFVYLRRRIMAGLPVEQPPQ